MGCGSCGVGKTTQGCNNSGGCSSGGCNRLNVYDWLHIPLVADEDNVVKIVEVSFKQGSRKDFFFNTQQLFLTKGTWVTIEGFNGFDMGQVSLTGELVKLQIKKRGVTEPNTEIKKILRLTTERDMDSYIISKQLEPTVLSRSRCIAEQLQVKMKICEVEIQADGRKTTFFYTADERIDFREMLKLFSAEFKTKIEMRQIGPRQEAAKIGGIGSCGRELCCSTWLQDFKNINTSAARYQNLSINQVKLSGQCGRLKCCLNYELDTYLDALRHFPTNVDTLITMKGTANLIKKDIFKNLMWYTLQGSTKYYPVTIERVEEIKQLNLKNIHPDDLEAIEIVNSKTKPFEHQFVDVVGQTSLGSLGRTDRKHKKNFQQQLNGNNNTNDVDRNNRRNNNYHRDPQKRSGTPPIKQ